MKHDELVIRQQRLLLRSAQLRITLADQLQVFSRPLALADKTQDALRWLSRHPQWPLGALLILMLVRPRRVVVWSGRLWWAWNMFKRARSWIATLPLQRS